MSGIAGIFFLDGQPVDSNDLQRMVQRLERRGPDGSGIWSQGPIGLGHCMLRTTPESLAETQPLPNATGDVVITADARIDNRAELLTTLGLRGRPSLEISDSELILHAYEIWGEACPAKLIGDFAFVIWDGRRQKLFCARDHFGVKSFYYYRSERVFVFASEIKALLCLPYVPRQLNEARIADFLVMVLESIDRTCTFYQDIVRFLPAHSMTVGCEGYTARAYWALDPTQELRFRSDEDYVEAFRDIFSEAVGCRLRSASAPGSMLSGGLDSSSIVGTASQWLTKNGGGRLHTFSCVDEDATQCDETRLVYTMINSLSNLEPCTIAPNQLHTYISDVEDSIEQMDDLFDTILMDTRLVTYSAARERGLNMLMDGVDGDIVTSHREAYLKFLFQAGAWKTVVMEAAGYHKFHERYYVPSTWQLLYHHGRAAFLPDWLRKVKQIVRGQRSLFNHLVKDSLINLDFAQHINLIGRYKTMEKNLSLDAVDTLRQYHANTIVAPYVTVALERYDRVASMFSIESRHPLYDKRLVEFCLALPWQQLVQKGVQKRILRRAMSTILPKEVRTSPKVLALPTRANLKDVWLAQQTFLKEILFDHSQDLATYVNLSAVHEMYRRYTSGKGFQFDFFYLGDVATLALWLRRNCYSFQN